MKLLFAGCLCKTQTSDYILEVGISSTDMNRGNNEPRCSGSLHTCMQDSDPATSGQCKSLLSTLNMVNNVQIYSIFVKPTL